LIGRHVALKLLAPEATQNDTARRRLLKEAQSASSLNHPNIVTIRWAVGGEQ
jgi:serine/threonine protein kinase